MFASSKFNADRDIPNLRGKVALVTGGMLYVHFLSKYRTINKKLYTPGILQDDKIIVLCFQY